MGMEDLISPTFALMLFLRVADANRPSAVQVQGYFQPGRDNPARYPLRAEQDQRPKNQETASCICTINIRAQTLITRFILYHISIKEHSPQRYSGLSYSIKCNGITLRPSKRNAKKMFSFRDFIPKIAVVSKIIPRKIHEKEVFYTLQMAFDLDLNSLYSIKGILLLDNDGNRILAKYYDKEIFPSQKEEQKFEKNLFQKTHKANSEIILLDGLICVYRSNVDVFFYVIGSHQENELILVAVLNALYDAFSTILRRNVEKKAILDNMDLSMLVLDEICDDGVVLETDAQAIVSRCALKPDELAFGDQSISQVGMSLLGSAKDQLKWSLLK
uniref:Coatomer subunit zeta n=2 Tax=Bursaphelenchus xylophilus TaxID=6326 RepID=A0A1I7SVV5_BURXY